MAINRLCTIGRKITSGLVVLTMLFLCSCSVVAPRQYKAKAGTEVIEGTYNTSMHPYYKMDADLEKAVTPIYTTRTNFYLVGQPCMVEFTRKLGFEYMAYDEYPHEKWGPIGFHFYNITSRIGLIFTAGPLWKSKVNKRLAQCRRASGDFIGLVQQTDSCTTASLK